MFLAIINDTYVEVKAELARQPDDFQVASFVSKVSIEGKTTVSLSLSQSWYRFLRAIRLTKEIPNMESNIDFDAWKTALRRWEGEGRGRGSGLPSSSFQKWIQRCRDQ